jgi:anti-anti-sigma factor
MKNSLQLLGGDYDISRKDDLEAELNLTEPHSDVVLDLATTDFIDCSCLGVLIMQLRTWREQLPDTNLRLQNVAPSIARMLGLLELDRLFVIESVRSNAQ